MRWRCVSAAALWVATSASLTLAAECPGRPDALGTSRVLTIDPAKYAHVGTMQYAEMLPLADNEVVLSFDDGPLPAHTGSVLETLASHCAKATFFMVGRMAQAHPDWVRRIYNAGHTVASHTQNHPGGFDHMAHTSPEVAVGEIDDGIASVETALGDPRALAPFFRFPGLRKSPAMERHLADRGILIWSADIPSDDWWPVTAADVVKRTLRRLEKKGKGVVLMHDIQARTVLALPVLLAALKARGYRIVHVVPAGADRPKTVSEPAASVPLGRHLPIWPIAIPKHPAASPELPAPSPLSFGFPHVFQVDIEILPSGEPGHTMRVAWAALERSSRSVRPFGWPAPQTTSYDAEQPGFAVPGLESLDLSQPLARYVVLARSPPKRHAAHLPHPKAPLDITSTPQAEVRLRGRIDEETQERHWARRLNWFH